MNCGTCGKCRECGSGIVWTGLSPAVNANAAAMNHVYHVINDGSANAPSIHVNPTPCAAAVVPPITFLYNAGPCADCGR